MLTFLIFPLVGIHLLLAFTQPLGLVYLALLTGPFPLGLGADDLINTPIGRMSSSAIRLFGLWLAAVFVIFLHFNKLWEYFVRYRLHFLFLLFCTFSLIWAPSLPYGARMLAKLTAPFLFLLLVLIVVSKKDQLKMAEQLIIGSGCLLLLAAMTTKLLGMNTHPFLTVPGLSPAVFSAHLVIVSMLTLGKLIIEKKLTNLFLLVIFFLAILAAFTRIPIFGLLIGASVILFFSYRGIGRLLLPTVSLLGLISLFLLNEQFRARMFIGGDKLTAGEILEKPGEAFSNIYGSGRFAAWETVLDKFFDPTPSLGSGVGATQEFFYSHSSTGLGVIHSEYVRLLAEVGIIGLVLFLLAFLAYGRQLRHTLLHAQTPTTKKYTLAALGGIIAYLVFIATDNGFDYVNQFSIYVFTLVAMSLKAKELETNPLPSPINLLHSEELSNSELVSLSTSQQRHKRRYDLLSDLT